MDDLPISNLKADLHNFNAMHIPSSVKIHWYWLKLSSRNDYTHMLRADNSVKNWRNLPISNLKPDLHNIKVHTEFGENSLIFTKVIIRKWKFGHRWQKTVKNWRNLPINNPKPELYNINANTNFGENPLTFTQDIILKRKIWTDGRTTDGRTDGTNTQTANKIPKYPATIMWQGINNNTLPLSCCRVSTIISCHYRVAGYKNA